MKPNASERIILIQGDNSKWYEQAIFIVKKDVPKAHMPLDFVQEAENIINQYMMRTDGKAKNLVSKYAAQQKAFPAQEKRAPEKKAQKRGTFDILLNAAMILCCVALCFVLFQIIP